VSLMMNICSGAFLRWVNTWALLVVLPILFIFNDLIEKAESELGLAVGVSFLGRAGF